MNVKQKPGRPRNDASASNGDKKKAIAEAAAQSFNSLGFDKTTIRHIAETAGVDPKLVVHYFGTKEELFAKTFSMPDVADEVRDIFAAVPRSDWGATIADILIDDRNRLVSAAGAGLIRASTTHPDGAAMFQEVVAKNSLGPFLASIGVDNAMMRGSTMETLILGFSVSDHILEIPLAPEAEYRHRKALFASLIQAILTDDVG